MINNLFIAGYYCNFNIFLNFSSKKLFWNNLSYFREQAWKPSFVWKASFPYKRLPALNLKENNFVFPNQNLTHSSKRMYFPTLFSSFQGSLDEKMSSIVQYLFSKCIKVKACCSKRNWVFATTSNFLISISLQSVGINLWYFKLRLFDLTEFEISKVYDIGLPRYRDKNIWVRGKNSVPLQWI